MTEQQQQHMPGGHYSGVNPIPTVKKFIENLDKDKWERDRKLEEQSIALKKANQNGEAKPHKEQQLGIKGTQKRVTDPTTGREVVIEDASKDMMKQVENPQVLLAPGIFTPCINLNIVICAKCKFRKRYSKTSILLKKRRPC